MVILCSGECQTLWADSINNSESKTYRKDDSGLKAPLRFRGVLCGETYKTDDSGIKAPLRNR